MLTLNIFPIFSTVSIADSEQVNISWDYFTSCWNKFSLKTTVPSTTNWIKYAFIFTYLTNQYHLLFKQTPSKFTSQQLPGIQSVFVLYFPVFLKNTQIKASQLMPEYEKIRNKTTYSRPLFRCMFLYVSLFLAKTLDTKETYSEPYQASMMNFFLRK